ncbi:hypothetical protein P3102_34995 [Amycolatopsis sp. QT-25]|uniref:hypothetical protein n=1 Tax=Amycolatopsis sp. QT-25 TaxID=3034022 RepID=UPI0023EAD6AF|nr:hypothetical protein [Amycolatopsis sp. QT-25]WET79180.1 hypothetical protein P3102_34995 [Amycolatopsis sp. QT-25]
MTESALSPSSQALDAAVVAEENPAAILEPARLLRFGTAPAQHGFGVVRGCASEVWSRS